MGSLVYGECKCGYKKEKMCLGGGMDSFETVANFPYYCKKCEEVVMHNTFMKHTGKCLIGISVIMRSLC